MERNEWSLDASIEKTARYCVQAERAEVDVLAKLFQWGIPKEHHENIITYLRNNNFLNHERYCGAFVHDKVAYQSWGRIKIRAALQSKHIEDTIIDHALQNIDEAVYHKNLQHLYALKKGDNPQKIIRFLLQRGYTYEEICEK